MKDIYADSYVQNLFDEMSKTYGLVHLFSSLGFAYFWRRACVNAIKKDSGSICDLMSGGAECLSHIRRHSGKASAVNLVDFSPEMCGKAKNAVRRNKDENATVLQCSALSLPVDAEQFDAVVSTFGLKTFSDDDLINLAREIKRVLKPKGSVSLLEFSMPSKAFIRFFFKLYVKQYVPFLGRLFLGNPDNYRMLWEYTVAFQNCKSVMRIFQEQGFTVQYKSYFFGSATQIIALRANE